MNTRFSKSVFYRPMFVLSIIAVTLLVTASIATWRVAAEEPEPVIRISTSNNYLRADNFTPLGEVTFTVYQSQGSGMVVLDISRTADESGHVFIDGFEHEADLVAGNYVVATDGTIEKRIELEPLTIEVFDPDTDFISGTASAGSSIWVVVGNNDVGYPVGLWAIATAEGTWEVDFTDTYDFPPEMWGSAVIYDNDGDETVFHKGWTPPPPNPFIAVSLTQHWFWVNNFTPSTLVTFYIYDNHGDESTILEFTRPTNEFGNLTIEGWEHIWNPEPGDYIVATDGSITKDLVLEYVTLDEFDFENDLVSGHALPGRGVDVGVGNETGEQWMNVIADDTSGIWVADFTQEGFGFDITEDSWGGGHVNDEDGDVTVAHNSGPPESPAWFSVFPEQDAIEGWNFPLGAVIHLEIDDITTDVLDYEQYEPVTFTPWGSWQLWVWFDLAGKYNMKAGDVVTLSYGEIVRTHTVQNLAVLKVNPEDNLVKGTADAGAEIHVWPHATGQEVLVTANPQGKWNVDFTGIYDLMRGDGGRARIWDENGNATDVDWYIPTSRIVASITEDWFYLQEFKPNTTVDFTVYEAQGEKPIWKGTATTDSSGFAWIEAEGRWDLEPGKYLLVKDGSNSKDLVIQGFTFDVFDTILGRLEGTAPEPFGRRVWIGIGWENDGWSTEVYTDQDGNWVADFGGPVPADYLWVAAQIYDQDGDASELRPALTTGN